MRNGERERGIVEMKRSSRLPFESHGLAWGRCLVTAAIACAFPCGYASAQIPEGWEIVEIAPPGTEYSYGRPDINDRGQIVFHRTSTANYRSGLEIWLFDHGQLLQVTDDNTYDSFPEINYPGDIVWQRDVDPDPKVERIAIVRLNDGQIDTLIDEPFYPSLEDIDDSGGVLWSRYTQATDSPVELLRFDGKKNTVIASNGRWNQIAITNQRGDIAFTSFNHYVFPWVSEIVGYFDGVLAPLSNGQRQVVLGGLNDFGQIVWSSPFDGVEIWFNGITTKLLQENAAVGGINRRGQITIARKDPVSGNSTLWLYADGRMTRLTEPALSAGIGRINSRGEIAFLTGRFPQGGVSLLTKPAFLSDTDSDGDIDLADFANLQNCFGRNKLPFGEICHECDGAKDGQLDQEDYVRMLEFWEGPQKWP